MKRVLVLGAGLVARPLVHYLTDLEDFEVTVASRTVSKAEALVAGRERGKALELNAKNEDALSKLIAEHDLSVSLLPASEHAKVARMCLEHNKHMSTTSYISEAMMELDADVKAAGLTFINECGVDPGIDHMSAMRVIHAAEAAGGKVVSFRSYCGGLPAPEANTNPIGYKFSWAPRGVLVAATAPARYMKDGEIVEVEGIELFSGPESVEVKGAGTFEGYPNRNSLPYIETYGLKDARTMFRGTLRNPGHCESWYPWVQLGLFDHAPRADFDGLTYKRFMQGFVDGAGEVKKALASRLGVPEDAPTITKLEWLGLFKDTPIGLSEGGNIDILAKRMLEKCQYAEGERDMLVMQHEFTIEYPDRTEQAFSTMVDFGIPGGDSSMARTVSLPVAIATRMILEGAITQRGIVAPVRAEVYNPILDELESLGIKCEERTA